MWYAIDILDNQLMRSIFDSIPTSVLFLDTVLLGEFKYLRSLIKKANDKNNQLKIRELCFCKPPIERKKPETFPYSLYPEYSAQHQIAEISAERCPIYIDLSNDITEEFLRSPLLSKDDILNPYALTIKIFNNNDELMQISIEVGQVANRWRDFTYKGAKNCKLSPNEPEYSYASLADILYDCADREEKIFKKLQKVKLQ